MPTRPEPRASNRPVTLRLVRGGGVDRVFARSLLERCTFPDPASGTEAAGGTNAPAKDGRFACAVSGGADSLALLVLALEAGLEPVAHHVDHGIRPDSGCDLDVVRAATDQLGVEVVSLRVSVPPGANLEARAREARFSVLPDLVATGHTADDQAETILINLLRGSAAAGLSGMASGRRHPILGLRRADTRAVCRESGLEWFEDPTNAELGPLRNRIRHDLLPALNALSGRDIVPILCRQADLMADDEAILSELASTIDPSSPRQLRDAPLPLARRAVRAWLREESGTGLPPSAAAVERVLEVARGGPLACEVGKGISVRRRRGTLVVERAIPSEVR